MGDVVAWDVRTWDNARRKDASLVVMVAAIVLVASGLILEFMLGSSALVLNVLIGLTVLLLVVEGAIHLAKPKAAYDAAPAPAASPAPSAAHAPHLTLKCGQCATVFDVADTGERPLYHTCPGCGAEGMLNAPGAEAAPAAAAPPARAPLRKLKLRCAACQTVFVVEDFGERPLRHACPGCGRKGELK